jgi:hypothetical protein
VSSGPASPEVGVGEHAFAPLTFYDAAGENPIKTDWCGFFADLNDETTFCGQLADHPVHGGGGDRE